MRRSYVKMATILLFLAMTTTNASKWFEYVNEDEPECRSDCSALTNVNEISACKKQHLEFYSFRMIKSMFNFAKVSIFAGLWVERYEKANEQLFERIFHETLLSYDNSAVLGTLKFEQLNESATYIYDQLKRYTLKQDKEIPYKSYPSLKCPTPCSYELVTWQTLFGISLTVFILSVITISLYTVFLRTQYMSLKNRLKSFSKGKQIE